MSEEAGRKILRDTSIVDTDELLAGDSGDTVVIDEHGNVVPDPQPPLSIDEIVNYEHDDSDVRE